MISDGPNEFLRFEYDPLGRRVVKTLVQGGQTRYAYDGEDVLYEQVSSGNALYLHGPGVDEPLAREDATGRRTYYHADALGSIVKRTDAEGVVIGTQTYDTFGNGSGLPNGYGFTGRETDAESGLNYYRARYYDPALGRFNAEDPLPVELRSSKELNGYVYARNSSPNRTDLYGLESGTAYRMDWCIDNPVCEPDYAKKQCLLSGGRWTTNAAEFYGGDVKSCSEACAGKWETIVICGAVGTAFSEGGPWAGFGAYCGCTAGACLTHCTSEQCFK